MNHNMASPSVKIRSASFETSYAQSFYEGPDSDKLRKAAVSRWMQKAENWAKWCMHIERGLCAVVDCDKLIDDDDTAS